MLLLALAPTCAAADAGPAPTPTTAQLVQQAFSELRRGNINSGQAELTAAIKASDFATLPINVRYRALMTASLVAEQNGQTRRSHGLAVRATRFNQADATAWLTRSSTAFSSGDYPDAALALAALAQRWPDQLDTVNPDAIWRLHYQLQHAHDANADRKMLDALFDAKWQDAGLEPNVMWRHLSLLLIQRHELARAAAVARRITSGQVALSMLVDKRFDPITLVDPRAFNVERLTAAEIKAALAQIRAHPNQLTPINHLQQLYLITQQYPQVIAISNTAVAHAQQGDGRKAYTDFTSTYDWILDNRSRAYAREGHWKQAVRAEVLAARRPEQGGMNVSERINLGDLYANLEQPLNASNAIIELGATSPFGHMQLESVKLKVAIEQKNTAGVAAAMGDIRKHRTDAIETWEHALLLHGDLDAAAAVLIERLNNPAWRNDALVEIQHYVHGERSPIRKLIAQRLDTIAARRDVRAVIRKVGRVEQFNITAPLR